MNQSQIECFLFITDNFFTKDNKEIIEYIYGQNQELNFLKTKKTNLETQNKNYKFLHTQTQSNQLEEKMSSTQTELVYMIKRLDLWGKQIGSANARKRMAGSEFDAWQQEFLIKRHEIQNMQNQKQSQGLNSKTASFGYKIREGITELQTSIGRMKEENRKLSKKKESLPQHSNRRQKIIDNCQRLLDDIKERQREAMDPTGYSKPAKILTLTDMRAKLLSDIEDQNFHIHQDTEGSEDQLADSNIEQKEAMKKYGQNDRQLDDMLDIIIDGVQGIKGKVKKINEQQDQIIDRTGKNKQAVEKVSKRIQTDNDKLKKIIKKFGPSRCCLSLTLLLLFIGLVVVVIKMFVLG